MTDVGFWVGRTEKEVQSMKYEVQSTNYKVESTSGWGVVDEGCLFVCAIS